MFDIIMGLLSVLVILLVVLVPRKETELEKASIAPQIPEEFDLRK